MKEHLIKRICFPTVLKREKSKKLRFLFPLLMALVMMAMSPTTAWALSGKGTADSPYLIYTADDLAEFRNIVNATNGSTAVAELKKDIDLSTLSGKWTPIGRSDHRYKGTFYGQDHTIYTMNMDLTGWEMGLFGFVEDATIKDFTLSGGTMATTTKYSNEHHSYGTAVGAAHGASVIENITSNVNIEIKHTIFRRTGGIVGGLNGTSKVKNCSYTGTVTCTAGNPYIGGIVGYAIDKTAVSDCVFRGTVTSCGGCQYVGGIIGYTNGTVDVLRCSNFGTVDFSSNWDCGGGIIGYINYHSAAKVENCLFAGTLKSSCTDTRLCLGGIVGLCNDEKHGFRGITKCLSCGTITNTASNTRKAGAIVGVIGNNAVDSITNNYYKAGVADVVGTVTMGNKTILGSNVSRTAAQISNGSVACELNGTNDGGDTWRQNIDQGNKDSYPVPDTSHGKVYCLQDTYCEGTAKGSKYYSNNATPNTSWHKVLTKTNAKAATCFNAGNNAYWTCSACKAVFSDADGKTATTVADQTIAAKGHGNGTDTKAGYTATYTWTDGTSTSPKCLLTLKCNDCSTTLLTNQTLGSGTGTLTKGTKTDATCTTTGSQPCSVSGTYTPSQASSKAYTISGSYTYTIAATGHSYEEHGAHAATCTATGNNLYYTCKNCTDVFDKDKKATTLAAQTIPATGHGNGTDTKAGYTATYTWTDGTATSPKCLLTLKCNDCSTTLLTNQTLGSGTGTLTKGTKTDATCTTTGSQPCSVSGTYSPRQASSKAYTISDSHSYTIAATGHSYEEHGAHAATCTATGNNLYYTCKNCTDVFDKDKKATTLAAQTIAAKGHKFVDGVCSVCQLDISKLLCFTAQEDAASVALTKTGSPADISLVCSTDGGATWADYTIGSTITLASKGDKLYMCAKTVNTKFSTNPANSYRFTLNKQVAASGDVTTLLNPQGTTSVPQFAFTWLFQGCSSLTSAPALPATTLATGCYQLMFKGCSSLTSAPALPATTLATGCYQLMFQGCSSLTSAPALPATTLATGCYESMFQGCTSLSSVRVNFTDWNTRDDSATGWLDNVAPTGTLICPAGLDKDATDGMGGRYVPAGWTVVKPTKGDVSADGRVSIVDLTQLVEILNNRAKDRGGLADVNGDGTVDMGDVTKLRNILLGMVFAEREATVGLNTKWQANDAISVLDGTNACKYIFTAANGTAAAQFSIAKGETGVTGSPCYALYPYVKTVTEQRLVTREEAEVAAGGPEYFAYIEYVYEQAMQEYESMEESMTEPKKENYLRSMEEYISRIMSDMSISTANQNIIMAYLKGKPVSITSGAVLNGSTIKGTVIPAAQTVASDQCVDPQAMLMVAQSNDNDILEFRNVCSFVKVTATAPCRKIEVVSHGGEILAAEVDVNVSDAPTATVTANGSTSVTLKAAEGDLAAGTYYIAVLPGTLSQGMDVRFYSSENTFEHSSVSTAVTLERNKVYDGDTEVDKQRF